MRDDQDGAEIVDVGQGRAGDHLTTDGGKEAVTVVARQRLRRAARLGVDPVQALVRNDAHDFFAAVGGQVITGPTLTNVNDFRAILIAPPA